MATLVRRTASRLVGNCFKNRFSERELPQLRVIETEIGFAEQANDYDRVEETPSGFPFKLEDKPGTKIVTLTRDYQGESVVVEVHMTNLVTGDKGDDIDDEESDEEEEEEHEDKPEKPKQSNDMWVTFPDDPSKDELAYEGPSFRVWDEKLRTAFHRYNEIRGIAPSMINFLHEYMINKDSKEHLLWLKTLKNFVKC
ncbi:hypothetical protein F2Q70_00007145 [Brassica cretica]|uniref:Mitochondrial glycoprotein family protein n=1 Tax=Brassica cretica TaxID=69181 RepID=A0A8S9M5V1_BRACR|nr:hypothetical protein F2Q70_00007145 [Brassica cretica]KAF3548334.1 hypothetical protein DY000_02000246 [Brassica cretica]